MGYSRHYELAQVTWIPLVLRNKTTVQVTMKTESKDLNIRDFVKIVIWKVWTVITPLISTNGRKEAASNDDFNDRFCWLFLHLCFSLWTNVVKKNDTIP